MELTGFSGFRVAFFSDANYAGRSNGRRSVSWTVVILGGATVSWARSTQRCVTLPTEDSEYAALGEGVKKALFTGVVGYRLLI